MPGPPPPPGVRFGANTYAGFGNPALEGGRGTGGGAAGGGFAGVGGTHDWRSQMDSFVSTTKTQTEGMMSQAKGWLSGALKSMADKLDGSSAAPLRAEAQKTQTGFHPYHAETPEEAARRRWDAAQTNLFAGGDGRPGPGGERIRTIAKGFYGDVDSDDDESSGGNASDGDSDAFPTAKRSTADARGGAFVPGMAGHAQGRASDRADVFANSIKGLASDLRTGEHLGLLLGRRRVRRTRRTVRDVRFATFGSRRRGMTLDTRRRLTRVVPLARRVLERLLRRLTRVVPLAR